MRRGPVRIGVAAAAIIALVALVPAPAAVAGALANAAYPGSSCPSTLSDCVASMAPGGVLRIVTNATITEDLSLQSSLTLKAGAGFHPTLTGDIEIASASGSQAITVQGLTIDGQVHADLTGGSGHVVRLRALDISDATRTAIILEATVPTRFEVTGSRVHIDGDGGSAVHGMRVVTNHESGTSTILLQGNRVDGQGNPDSGTGIFVGFENFGTGHTDVHIYNNSVFDTGRCASCDAGVTAALWVNTEFAATSDVDIVGNTFARSGVDGVILRALLDVAGGFTTMHVYDNIVSHADHQGLRVTSDPARMTLDADHNVYFANDEGNSNQSGEPFGAHDRAVKPGYVDLSGGDLRLRPTSPLIDAGLVCTPGELGYLDAAGHVRVAGASVDVGAFERGAGAGNGKVWFGGPGGETHTGTDGPDILCGMGGGDTLRGGGGADHVNGGGGPDTLIGGKGSDRLLGEAGGDRLCAKDGTGGNDTVLGGPGTDRFRADPGDARSGVELAGAC